MNQPDKWIFEDNHILIDKAQFENYLESNNVIVGGHLKDIMDDTGSDAWRYPAYASVKCKNASETIKKIRLLAKNRGDNDNEREGKFNNQLEEFRGLYCLCNILKYDFSGWDKCRKGINNFKDCDIALLKDGQKYYAEIKDSISEIKSQKDLNELKKNPDDSINKVILSHNIEGVKRYKPVTDLNWWLRKQIKAADAKGADILICHFPWQGMPALTGQNIKKDYADMMDNTVEWDIGGCPILSDNVITNLSKLIVINKLGCWVIKVKRVSNPTVSLTIRCR